MKFFFHVLDLFYSSAWLKTKYFLPSHLQIQDFFKYNFSSRGGDEFFYRIYCHPHVFLAEVHTEKKNQKKEAILGSHAVCL